MDRVSKAESRVIGLKLLDADPNPEKSDPKGQKLAPPAKEEEASKREGEEARREEMAVGPAWERNWSAAEEKWDPPPPDEEGRKWGPPPTEEEGPLPLPSGYQEGSSSIVAVEEETGLGAADQEAAAAATEG